MTRKGRRPRYSGSAKKRSDRPGHTGEAGRVEARVDRAEDYSEWEADCIPLPLSLKGDPSSRPVRLMIARGNMIVHYEEIRRPPTELEEIADLYESAARSVAQKLGGWPQVLNLRYECLAEVLADRLVEVPVDVRFAHRLDHVDRVMKEALELMSVGHLYPLTSQPDTWAGWGLPAELVADLFDAAAGFYRAEKWMALADHGGITVLTPGNDQWTVLPVNSLEGCPSLALFQQARDVPQFVDQGLESDTSSALRGAVLLLVFVSPRDLPEPMRQEIRAEGWELGGWRAYPVLKVFNTPAGGLSRGQARLLADLLRALPQFADQVPAPPRTSRLNEEPQSWTDPVSGIELRSARARYPEARE